MTEKFDIQCKKCGSTRTIIATGYVSSSVHCEECGITEELNE